MTETASRGKTMAPLRSRSARQAAASVPKAVTAGYKGGKEMPLGAYAAIIALYGAAVGGLAWAASRKKRAPLAERVAPADIALLGVATHKVSRLLAKDWVTSPIRAPFTEYKGSTQAGEVEEKARGEGMQLAVGQLVT